LVLSGVGAGFCFISVTSIGISCSFFAASSFVSAQ